MVDDTNCDPYFYIFSEKDESSLCQIVLPVWSFVFNIIPFYTRYDEVFVSRYFHTSCFCFFSPLRRVSSTTYYRCVTFCDPPRPMGLPPEFDSLNTSKIIFHLSKFYMMSPSDLVFVGVWPTHQLLLLPQVLLTTFRRTTSTYRSNSQWFYFFRLPPTQTCPTSHL